MSQSFEYIVIGNGLFGSSVAKYISYHSISVALIGPNEPEDKTSFKGPLSWCEIERSHSYL